MDKDIQIILNEKNGRIDLLCTGYNIIAKTIYNEELTKKIIELIIEELKSDNYYEFTTLGDCLKLDLKGK